MISIETMTTFFGWCSVINLGILLLAGVLVAGLRHPLAALHGRLYGMAEADLARAYFQFLAQYKIATFVFAVVPYVALRVMA